MKGKNINLGVLERKYVILDNNLKILEVIRMTRHGGVRRGWKPDNETGRGGKKPLKGTYTRYANPRQKTGLQFVKKVGRDRVILNRAGQVVAREKILGSPYSRDKAIRKSRKGKKIIFVYR